MKSRNYETRNNELCRYNEVKVDDDVIQVSIKKCLYNEVSGDYTVDIPKTDKFNVSLGSEHVT